MKNIARPLLFLALPVLLSACAIGKRNFDCPGMPDGTVCKSPQEVYRMTNSADRVTAEGENSQGGQSAKAGVLASALVPTQLVEPLTQPMPVLEPAQTMRAWVAPWIDRRGDLHFPSLLFTEVTPRRWSIGEAAGREARILVPLSVDSGAGNRLLERNDEDSRPGGGAVNLPGLPGFPSLPVPPASR